MCVNIEGSGETAWMPEPSPVAYVISTKSHKLVHFITENIIILNFKSDTHQ